MNEPVVLTSPTRLTATLTATHLLWQAAGQPPQEEMRTGRCRVCGAGSAGQDFAAWVKPTFTDHDKLQAGEIICPACQFAFAEASIELQARVGKAIPQRMRNYSHIIAGGTWYPLSKGAKAAMRRLILEAHPALIVLADSGQKHLVFRAVPNDPVSTLLRIQFEEQAVLVARDTLARLVATMTTLLTAFSKTEIASGNYAGHRILSYGLAAFRRSESILREYRGSGPFAVALYLAQKEDSDGGTRLDDSTGDLAGVEPGLQEPLSNEYLAAVRGPGTQRGVHDEPQSVRQLALFKDGR